eukprot:g5840.t1
MGQPAQASGCTPCAAGTYKDEATTTTCKKSTCNGAAAGSYDGNDQTGQQSIAAGCLKCVPGKYRDDATMTCKACATGKYTNEEGRKTCKDQRCCLGTYAAQVTAGATTEKDGCTKCPKGKYQDENNKNAAACTDCAKGTYADLAGASVCKQAYCALGQYMTETGQSSLAVMCKPCPSGMYKGGTALTGAFPNP